MPPQRKQRWGGASYVPPEFDNELHKIMQEEGLHSRAEAFRKAARYTQLGKEAKKAGMKFDLPTASLPNTSTEFMQIPRKEKKKGKDKFYFEGL